ncbi:MAG TPA: Na+/H+ antiporter [Streptosporangiaceae bacterium]|nr:Na+/H+ antiporter [Streptosporangiaceae bacterium]
MRSVEIILALVVLATVVAAFAGRLRVPAPSLLVVAGLAAGLVPGVPRVEVTPEIVSLVVLPPLLYAAGQELPLRDLRAVWRPVAVLATGLVLASAAAVAAVARAVTPLPGSMALVLGAVLASTDPVAVSALGRRLPLPARLHALVQAESLFNDATSLVLFRVAVAFAAGTAGAGGWAGGISQFALLAGGGAAVGAATAGAVALVRRRITDPVLETVVALVTPYAAYLLAEAPGVSGVTSVVVASVILSSRNARLTTAQSRLQLHSVYQTVVFLLESVVFALIGLELPAAIRELSRGEGSWPAQALAVAATLIAVRALGVFPVLAIARRRDGTRPWPEAAVATWAGARGVVPLAAALSIPLTSASGAPVPGRDLVLVLAAAVIVASLLGQGLTLEPLVRRAGIARPATEGRHEATLARLRTTEAALSWLEQLAADAAAPDDMIDRLRRNLQARSRVLEDNDGAPAPSASSTAATYLRLRQGLLDAQRDELTRLHSDGEVSDATRRRLQRQLDLEETGLADT